MAYRRCHRFAKPKVSESGLNNFYILCVYIILTRGWQFHNIYFQQPQNLAKLSLNEEPSVNNAIFIVLKFPML